MTAKQLALLLDVLPGEYEIVLMDEEAERSLCDTIRVDALTKEIILS